MQLDLMKAMKIKEKIKSKIDHLEPQDLRKVKLFIDSLTDKRKVNTETTEQDHPPYMDVMKLLGNVELTSGDIHKEREERI